MALEVDLSCSVCTELFSDPVLLSCGHSFCRQCINDHWTSSRSRRCPVCQQMSPQQLVSNLSLRNTCESYLREQNTRTYNSGGHKCQIHGEKIELFCQIDGKALCSTCKKQMHDWHETQPLQQAVRQRKWKLKANLRSAEKTLVSLQNGTAQDNKISKYIQVQSQMTERSIRMEFEKLHQFLRKEEESRIAALNEEEKQKGDYMERRIQEGILSLFDKVKDVEERIEDDDITFLKNYDHILNRTKCMPADAELSSETVIDVPKYLGNLKYQVWEKMKDICPYYTSDAVDETMEGRGRDEAMKRNQDEQRAVNVNASGGSTIFAPVMFGNSVQGSSTVNYNSTPVAVAQPPVQQETRNAPMSVEEQPIQSDWKRPLSITPSRQEFKNRILTEKKNDASISVSTIHTAFGWSPSCRV